MYTGRNFRSHLIAAALMRSMAVDVGIEEKKRERGIRWSSPASAWREEQLGFHLPVEHVTRPAHLGRTRLQCAIDAAFNWIPDTKYMAEAQMRNAVEEYIRRYSDMQEMSGRMGFFRIAEMRVGRGDALRTRIAVNFAQQALAAGIMRGDMEKQLKEKLQSIANQYGVTYTIER